MEDNAERPSYEPELTEPPVATPNAKYTALQRLWMVFMSPGEVFADIRIKPTWVLLLIVLIVLTVAVQFTMAPHVDTDATLRAQLGDRADDLNEAQIENMVEQAERFGKFGPLITLFVSPIIWALMAAIFLVLLKIVGSDADFLKTLSTILHAYWPAGLVHSVLTMILVQRIGAVPQQELTNVVKASIGSFMSPDSPAWLTAIASTFSVFNVWAVILLIFGFAAVGKISRGKAAVVALVPWIVWMAVKAGLATIF